jgi:hypothetical protein
MVILLDFSSKKARKNNMKIERKKKGKQERKSKITNSAVQHINLTMLALQFHFFWVVLNNSILTGWFFPFFML